MDKKPTVVLVGMGGYGNLYVNELLRLAGEGKCDFTAAVDPFAEKAAGYEKIKSAGVKIYSGIEDFYAENTTDLCCISAPIQYHTPYTLCALRHGSHVLCEKPLSGDRRDAEIITAEAEKRGLFVMSGYQWSHSPAIISLKKDILAGKFGSPVSMKTAILWPRRQSYFRRGSGWAGIKYATDGTPVFDSVANNAAAHYLHNMLYLLGGTLDSAAVPETIDAELFRANKIENFDTSVIRMNFGGGVSALFIASHTIARNRNPRFEYRFECGEVHYDHDGGGSKIIAKFSDGREKDYGDPFECDANKIRTAVKNASLPKEEWFLPCTAKTAASHTKCICALSEAEIVTVPEELIEVLDENTDPLITVCGMDASLEKCYSYGEMISECSEIGKIKEITKTQFGIKVEK